MSIAEMDRKADIIAKVRFYTADEGGRSGPTPSDIFRCPLEFSGEKFDCGLHLDKSGSISPGEEVIVPITFLVPELVKPRLLIGSKFTLWEMRTVAEGVVVEIIEG